MSEFKNKLISFSNEFTIKRVSYANLFLNLVSAILGLVYIGTISAYNVTWDILGVVLIITLFGNLLLIWLNSAKLNTKIKKGKWLNLFCYLYLVFYILAMFGMLFGNLFISVDYAIDIVDNAIMLISYGMIYGNYFGLMALGVILAVLDIKNLGDQELWSGSEKGNESKVVHLVKFMLKILCYLTFAVYIYICYIIFFASFDNISGFIGVLVSASTLFGAFMALSTTIIFLIVKEKEVNPKSYNAIALIGIIISGIFMVPLFLTPYSAFDAENNFTNAFGFDWHDKIPDDVEEKYFLQTTFSTPQYFLGIPPEDVRIMQHVLFYEDDQIELHFDAYIPPDDVSDLPGKNSMLIRIHGGGWVWGDKGWENMMQMNKYFAAQGYVVFDIEYRIYDFELLAWEPLTPDYRKGDFTIDQIVESIGFFTKFIVENSADYGNPNLGSVFVSGGSAGGHLTCALGLGITSGKYTNYFGNDLTIKGIIPYYPGNGLAPQIGLEGSDELIDPSLLVDSNSPPCLIYHGTSDGMVPPRVSEALRQTYIENENTNCAVLWQPLGGHASDRYFSGYYNQVFLYYYERFLYLCVNDLI